VTVAGCELCEAARLTPWWYEDDLCWVADCEACDAPIVVWRQHGDQPTDEEVAAMIGRLEEVASSRFGSDGFRIDRVMRQIPDHFHAHARPGGAFWGRSQSHAGGAGLHSQVGGARLRGQVGRPR
jgi:hypothetical protein